MHGFCVSAGLGPSICAAHVWRSLLSEVSIVATPAGKPGFFGFVRFGFVGFVRFVRFGCSVVFFIGFIMSIYIKIAPDRIGFKCFKTRAGRNHTHCACGFFPPGSCVNVFYSSMAKLQHFQSGIVCPDKELWAQTGQKLEHFQSGIVRPDKELWAQTRQNLNISNPEWCA